MTSANERTANEWTANEWTANEWTANEPNAPRDGMLTPGTRPAGTATVDGRTYSDTLPTGPHVPTYTYSGAVGTPNADH